MARKKKNEPERLQTTAIYARYSSTVQNDASIEQQIAECEEYARQHGLVIVATYEDRAISGKKDNRPGLQRMLRAADRHEFQVLLAYKSNRISRNMTNALRYEERLSNAGVRVVYCKEEFGDNATGRFMLRTMMNMNQFYSENMAEDIVRGLRDSAQKCRVLSVIPYGYKKGEDGKFAIDEQAAPIVEEIFRRFVDDESYADIARDLNERGILTKQKKPWGKNSFHNIISNERYTGTYIYDDIRIEGGMPKIVERSVFEMAQQKLGVHKETRARHRDNEDYLLTGKLYCGHCLGAMVGLSGRGHLGSNYFYYACQTRRIQKTCDRKNVKKDWIEEQVTRAVLHYVLNDETVEWIANTLVEVAKKRNAESKLAEYEKRLNENKKQIMNILRAVEMGIVTDEFKERVEELNEEKKQLTGLVEIERATSYAIDKYRVITYLESVRKGDPRDKKFQRQIINDFVRAVYLYDDYFKLSIDFTGKNTVYKCPFRGSPDDGGGGGNGTKSGSEASGKGLYNASNGVPLHSYTNPGSRNRIDVMETGFVITWYFDPNM